jgi:hypothetical protein
MCSCTLFRLYPYAFFKIILFLTLQILKMIKEIKIQIVESAKKKPRLLNFIRADKISDQSSFNLKTHQRKIPDEIVDTPKCSRAHFFYFFWFVRI